MTGPEHYREAEYLLASSIHLRAELLSGDRENEPADYTEPDRVVALAQVHATLALAAATALDTTYHIRPSVRPSVPTCGEWLEAISDGSAP